jgi:hypothetical protein
MNTRKLKISFLLSASLLILSVTALADQSFQYWVRIPATQNTCEAEATALGSRFAAATGKTVTAAQCQDVVHFTADGKDQTLYSLLVTYTATDALAPFTAVLGTDPLGTYTGSTTGAYSTYSDCLADMAPQGSNYTKYTSLSVVSESCLPSNADSTYLLSIDGFGAPAKNLYVFLLDFQGTKNAELVTDAAAMLQTAGAGIVKQDDAKVFYYAVYPIMVEHDSIGDFASVDDCNAQFVRAGQIFANAGDTQAVLKCMGIQVGTTTPVTVNSLEVIHMGGAMVNSDYGAHSAQYFSLKECMTDEDRLLGTYNPSHPAFDNPQFLGGLCVQDFMNGNYRLFQFSK